MIQAGCTDLVGHFGRQLRIVAMQDAGRQRLVGIGRLAINGQGGVSLAAVDGLASLAALIPGHKACIREGRGAVDALAGCQLTGS